MLNNYQYQKSLSFLSISFVLLLFLCSCSSYKEVQSGKDDDGFYLIEKQKLKKFDSAYFNIEISEINADKNTKSYLPLKASDVWLNDSRYECNPAGKAKIAVKAGKYKLTARSIGFKSISNDMAIKKDEVITIKYYLDYYRPNKSHQKYRGKIKRRSNKYSNSYKE